MDKTHEQAFFLVQIKIISRYFYTSDSTVVQVTIMS